MIYFKFINLSDHLTSCTFCPPFHKPKFYIQIKINNPNNNFIISFQVFEMLNKTLYLNGLTKQQQLEFNMESLKNNLKNMKAMNNSAIELQQIEINRNKGKYISNRRFYQINLENVILNQKIDRIVSRNSKYFSGQEKYSKSLNGFVKRTTQEKISEDNTKLLTRLEESKPTYLTKKLLKQFEHIQMVEKKMSSADFYLTESPNFRKKKLNTNRSFLSGRSSSLRDNQSLCSDKNDFIKEEVTLNDGKLWEIKIYKEERWVKITGEILISLDQKQVDQTQLKLIKIPNVQANAFLRKHCENKLKNLIKHLKVDEKDQSLMLVVPSGNKSPHLPSKFINPQEQNNGTVKRQALKKIPARQAFRNAQQKIELPQNLQRGEISKAIVFKQQAQKIDQIKTNKLPLISSKNHLQAKRSPKIGNQVKPSQQKIKQTEKDSVSSIKSNSIKQTSKTAEVNAKNESKHSIEQDEKFQKQKSKKSSQKEEQYEDEQFQDSRNANGNKQAEKMASQPNEILTKQEVRDETDSLNGVKIQVQKPESINDQKGDVQKFEEELALEQSHSKKNKVSKKNLNNYQNSGEIDQLVQNQVQEMKNEINEQNLPLNQVQDKEIASQNAQKNGIPEAQQKDGPVM